MKVSIITTTYNSAATIRDTLLSVKQQTHRDLEHIIIDGESKDNTINLLTYFGHSGPLVSERDNGIYDAMNKGLALATGDIIGILNSDDFYPDSDIIENVVQAFEDTDCDAVYGDLVFVEPQRAKRIVRKWIAGNYSKHSFYQGWMPPHPTFFVRREVYEKLGRFNLDFKSSSDYELLLRFMLLNNIKVKYVPRIMVHMRAGGQSNSSLKNRLVAHKEDYRAWKANGLTPRWYTLAMKPLRKLPQYLVGKDYEYSNGGYLRSLFPAPSFHQLDAIKEHD